MSKKYEALLIRPRLDISLRDYRGIRLRWNPETHKQDEPYAAKPKLYGVAAPSIV